MAVNFSALTYLPNFNFWARPITVTPIASQPGAAAYGGVRGIYDTRGTTVMTDAGMAVMSDQETILDIRDDEFGVVPAQGDIIDIPPDGAITVGVGTYEVTDASANGGGETTLVIRKWEASPVELVITSSGNPSTVGEDVTFTAVAASEVGRPIGTMNFNVDGGAWTTMPVSAGSASWTAVGLDAGDHEVIAEFTPHGSEASTAQASLTQTMLP